MLILDEVEALSAVEGELLVARQQGQTLGDGVGNNHVVAEGRMIFCPSL